MQWEHWKMQWSCRERIVYISEKATIWGQVWIGFDCCGKKEGYCNKETSQDYSTTSPDSHFNAFICPNIKFPHNQKNKKGCPAYILDSGKMWQNSPQSISCSFGWLNTLSKWTVSDEIAPEWRLLEPADTSLTVRPLLPWPYSTFITSNLWFGHFETWVWEVYSCLCTMMQLFLRKRKVWLPPWSFSLYFPHTFSFKLSRLTQNIKSTSPVELLRLVKYDRNESSKLITCVTGSSSKALT